MNYEEFDLFNLLHDVHQSMPLKLKKEHNSKLYPKVIVSNACPTPTENWVDRENLLLIGAGSGIAPFLPILDEAIRAERGKDGNLFEQEKAPKSVFLVFIAREGEQISWVSNYIFHLLSSECLIPQFDFYIYITMQKNCETLPSFLFWRALLLIGATLNVCIRSPTNKYEKILKNKSVNAILQNSAVKIKFGRPNFLELFSKNIDKFSGKF